MFGKSKIVPESTKREETKNLLPDKAMRSDALVRRGSERSDRSHRGISMNPETRRLPPLPTFPKLPELVKTNLISVYNDVISDTPKDEHHHHYRLDREPKWVWKDEELGDFAEIGNLKVLCITWNMLGKEAPPNLDDLLRTHDTKHHIIALGTEECWRSIALSLFYSSKIDWEKKLIEHLKGEYHYVGSKTLDAIHLILFAHKSVYRFIDNVQYDAVPTGLANILGNKGGVGISFEIMNKSMLFVNCHLAHGQENVHARNSDFNRIDTTLRLPPMKPRHSATPGVSHRPTAGRSASDESDIVFWLGDLNYRINGTMDSVNHCLTNNKHEVLLANDQLYLEREAGRIPRGFKEGFIKFPPTYKLKEDKHQFQMTKGRIPSWTDRILYKSKKADMVNLMNYECITNLLWSDHRAVFAQFHINLSA